jgi:uncharacterized protein
MSTVTRLDAKDRVLGLDVVRGLAVLGILMVNAAYFAAPWQTSINPTLAPLAIEADTFWSWFIPHVFFEFKFITLFSMLFGVSVFLVGGERGDAARGKVLRRRLFWLAIFGLIHGLLIWSGDILFNYATVGVLMLFARSWRPGILFGVGLVLFTLSAAMQCALGFFAPFIPDSELATIAADIWAPAPEDLNAAIAAMRGDLISATSHNMSEWLEYQSYAFIGALPRILGAMMIGLALFKLGFFSATWKWRDYILMAVIGALGLAAIFAQALYNAKLGFPFVHMMGAGLAANAFLSPLAALFYASLLLMLVKGGALRFLQDALANVGRLAFSNYITQSLIMTTIFWGGRGFGLYGEVDRPTLIFIVLGVWLFQLIGSSLWLSRFEIGPLEWVWRALSTGGPVRFKRRSGASA